MCVVDATVVENEKHVFDEFIDFDVLTRVQLLFDRAQICKYIKWRCFFLMLQFENGIFILLVRYSMAMICQLSSQFCILLWEN